MTAFTPPAPPRIDDFERSLFESAREDTVPEASRRRVALALGISPGMSPGGASDPGRGPSAGRSRAPTRASGAVSAAQPSKLGWLGKSALLGLAGGGIALGVASFDGPSSIPVAPPRPASSATPALAPSVESVHAVPEVDAPEPATRRAADAFESAPSAAAQRTASQRAATPLASKVPGRAHANVAHASSAGSRLIAEVQRLDTARNALAAGRAEQALNELERYDREFPGGTLALDGALLEVRALDRTGRRAAAHRRARQLLSRPGAERHRAELEAMLNPLASGSKSRRRDIEETR